MGASKRPATNDKTAPIKKNVVTEDIVAVVDSISNWVAKHCGKSANVASIIDISVVSAVGSLIHGAINHNALPVENDGVDKLPSTINNATSQETRDSTLGDDVGVTEVVSWVTIYNINPVHLVAVVEITAIRHTMSSIAGSSNDQVLPIEDNPIAEDIVPIVDSMTNWVAIQLWLAINKPTIVDIATMSAAASFIGSSINDNAMTIIGKVAGNVEFISKTRGAESRRGWSTYFSDNTNVNSTMVMVAHLMGNGVSVFNVMVYNVLVMNIMVNKMFVMNIMVHMVKMVHVMVHFVMMGNLMINIVNMVNGLMG